MARPLLCALLLLLSLNLLAQEKCAFVPYQKQLAELSDKQETAPEFEKWIQQRQLLISSMRAAGQNGNSSSTPLATEAKWVIPVVVHVIHRGEALGTASNIPLEQIKSQLNILNSDFRAKNTTEINNLPAAFKALAADSEIEFVLAKQDPEGLPTDGIVRVYSDKVSWDQPDDLTLKQLSHWPSHKYLNIYVATLAHPVLGWAQFPSSDQLQGLNFGDVAEETDGVVIDYRYFGSGYNASAGSKGRTATHEIGHYFGLRHIWGDGDCQLDDYVDDTPKTDKENTGCPTDKPKNCAGSDAMFQNFLDYTDDKCMALFTLGQKQRMDVVLQYSPRRKDLHHSSGKQDPILVADDAGIREIKLSPLVLCNASYKPIIEVRNYGNNQLSSLEVVLSVDGTRVKQYNFSMNLAYLESKLFELNELSLSSGEHTVSATITATNGKTDGKAVNNTASASIQAPLKTSLPFSYNFEAGVYPFSVINPDLSYTWQMADAPNGLSSTNKAMAVNFYDYGAEGQKDILLSPILDLRAESKVYMSLRVAYARYDRTTADGLEIWISSDCSGSLSTADRVYQASGEELATAPSTTSPFKPKDGSQWSSLTLDLSAYAGRENIQVLLVSVNNYGNHLYVDDFQIMNNFSTPLNVALSEIVQPSPVIGGPSCPLHIRLHNLGTETINTLKVKVSLNGGEIKNVHLQDLALLPLTEKVVSLGTIEELGSGPHQLRVQTYAPNDGFDAVSSNDVQMLQFVVNPAEQKMPLRESYTTKTFSSETIWTSSTPEITETGWLSSNVLGHDNEPATKNYAALAQYSGNVRPKAKWLVSPRFNMSQVEEAGIQFWYYAGGESPLNLRLMASFDGGNSWPLTLWEKSNQELKAGNPTAALSPASSALWHKEFISLADLIGENSEKHNVRFAMVSTGEGSSSIYVDDIEFFLDNEPTEYPKPALNDVTIFPNPARNQVHLHFNMAEYKGEDVRVELMSGQGALITKMSLPNTLNQNYTFDLPNIPAGIYYIRIRSASLNTTRKLVVVR